MSPAPKGELSSDYRLSLIHILDESLPLNPALPAIKGVKVLDGPFIVEATISNEKRTIHVDLLKATPGDLKALKVYLHISKRATLISHADTALVLDLTKPQQIVVNNLYKDLTYTMTASIRENFEIEKKMCIRDRSRSS